MDSSSSILRSIPIIRFAIFAVFFILFQAVILLQRPFIQIDFVYSYYSCLAFISGMYFVQYYLKIDRNSFFSFVEIMTIIVLFKSQPMFSSFFLVMILILLFLAGLESEIDTVVYLVFSSSILISLGNLLFFKWSGLQNILNIGLFNLAFFAVLFFSTQLKFELKELSESLSETTIKLKSKAELAQILIEHIPVGLMALDSSRQLVFVNQILEKQMKLNRNSMLDLIGFGIFN